MTWKNRAKKHFINCNPLEGCGLLVQKNNEITFWPCKNIAPSDNKDVSFAINPMDFANCEDSGGNIIGVAHSHPKGTSEPSDADIKNCKISSLDWYIYSISNDDWHYIDSKL